MSYLYRCRTGRVILMADANYYRVYNRLKEQIRNGEYPVGSLLPSEGQLEQIFHLSRITIRKAVELLSEEGFVQKQRGHGTYVLDYKVTQNLNTLTSLTETLKKRGYTVTIESMEITPIISPDLIMRVFNYAKPVKMAYIRRLVYVSGEPLCIIENYIPYTLVEGIEEDVNSFQSLYHHLETKYMLYIDMSKDHLFAMNADEATANILHVENGFALMCVDRICIRQGVPVIYDVLKLRSDRYSYDLTLYNRESQY